MILTLVAAAMAAQLGLAPAGESSSVHQMQYCGNGYDIDIHGRCYPNGVIPPQYHMRASIRGIATHMEPRRHYGEQYRRRDYRDDDY